jgi:hypothetical protein
MSLSPHPGRRRGLSALALFVLTSVTPIVASSDPAGAAG